MGLIDIDELMNLESHNSVVSDSTVSNTGMGCSCIKAMCPITMKKASIH